jgi:hypothetical protein
VLHTSHFNTNNTPHFAVSSVITHIRNIFMGFPPL